MQPKIRNFYNHRYKHHILSNKEVFSFGTYVGPIYEYDMVSIIFNAAKNVIILHAHEYIPLVY